MIQDLKALVVILVLAAPVWYFSQRLFSQLSAPGDFERRRNTWLVLTVLGMISPSIWIYAAVALPVMYWAGRRDSNPVALYLLLFYVVPKVSVQLPTVLINQLFEINNQRLLALAIILPAWLRSRKFESAERWGAGYSSRRLDASDWLLVGYISLTIFLPSPFESLTNTMRRTFLVVLDTGLLFAVCSRLAMRREVFKDCLGAWVLAALLMSVVAMFETARSWLLYVSISSRWGDPNAFSYLLRGDLLRAQATAGHSLTLGIWLATSWAFFLFIQSEWKSWAARTAGALILLGGLGASMARGAWLAALVATFVYLLLNPKGAIPALKALGTVVAVIATVLLSPFGQRFIEILPFVGVVDTGSVDYRKQLFEVSVGLIASNPWFGSPFVLSQMESLRQGQGIIDLVNGYITVALFSGLVGLSLFGGLLVVAVVRGLLVWRLIRNVDLIGGLLGASLLAALLGTMIFIATAGIDPMTYMLAGLLSSYWWMFSRNGSRSRNIPDSDSAKVAA